MPVFNCLSCQRLLYRPDEFLGRAWQCPNCGPVSVSDDPVPVSHELATLLEKEYRLGLPFDPSDDVPPELNPIPRIARKRSLILRYLDPDMPKARRMLWAFLISLGLPAILAVGCCVISPPPAIPWVVIVLVVLFFPAVRLTMMLMVRFLDMGNNPKYAEIALPGGHSDKFDRKQVQSPDTNPTDTAIAPSPSRGTIQPDPEKREPSDA
jgi:hypothetical protein